MNESVAALINDQIISTYDLQQRMRLMVLTSGVQATADSLQQIAQEALRALTDEHLEMQELERIQKRQKDKKDTLIATDKEVDDEIANLAKANNLTYAQLKGSFAAAGVDIQSLRDQVRTQISWQRLVGGMYGSRIKIGDDQVAAELRRLADAASQPQYEISEIVIDPARVGGEPQAMSGAEQLIAQLQKGAPFPAVARQFSSATTAANGGDAGWVSAAQEPPEVAKVLVNLRAGQLSAPIETTDGVYIIYLRDRLAASSQTMVDLKQMAIRLPKDAPPDQVAAATATLDSLKAEAKGCASLDGLAAKTKGVMVADLGEAEINDLSGPFKTAAQTLQPDQVSDPIRTEVGLHLVAVCSKRSGGANMPTKSEIENRMYSEQLAVMSRRYLRDLRNSADIETR
ncbi:MAG TPA: peptidylprolyl isomerase [Caulobacteraceae bacterium]|nr:peptidylprolyl isomerase [Caulobacteraceae bacterium]